MPDTESAVGSYFTDSQGVSHGPYATQEERDRQALIGDGAFVLNKVGDTFVNPDPNRTLDVRVMADGTIYFTANFREPGCFSGTVAPDGGVIAYVYPVDAVGLDDETDCVTCLDTYEARDIAAEARRAARNEDAAR